MTSNISQVALQDSQALRNIGQAAEEMKSALQLGDLEQKYRAFAERIDKIYDLQQRNKRELAEQKKAEQEKEKTFQTVQTGITQFIRTGAGVTQRLGQTGDVVGAGIDVLGNLGDLIKGLPGWAKIAGTAVTMIGGLAFAGNAAEKQYEKVLPVVMDVTAALGRLGKTAKESSMAFRTTMKEVADTASKFGYSLEEGARVFRGLAEAGATGKLKGDVEQVMAYARAYGISPELASRYLGMGRRFGMKGNLLGIAAGALDQAGMDKARYQEFLNSTLSIFEEGLSRGVVKGFEDINATQTWLSKLGEVFKGQTGLQIYRKMDSSVTRATSLASDKDIILFRAARRLAGENASYVDVMKILEKGLTSDLFTEVKKEIVEMAGEHNKIGQIELTRKVFDNLSYHLAEKVLGLGAKEAVKEIKATKVTDTEELKVLKKQLEIQEKIREIGSRLVGAKAGALSVGDKLVGLAVNAIGANPDVQQAENARKQRWEKFKNEGGDRALNVIGELLAQEINPNNARNINSSETNERASMISKLEGAIKKAVENPRKYSKAKESAAKLIDMLAGLSPEEIKEYKKRGLLIEALEPALSLKSPGSKSIVPSELIGIAQRLISALESLEKATNEAANSEIIVGFSGSSSVKINPHSYGRGSVLNVPQPGGR